jgi:hypothetical protein
MAEVICIKIFTLISVPKSCGSETEDPKIQSEQLDEQPSSQVDGDHCKSTDADQRQPEGLKQGEASKDLSNARPLELASIFGVDEAKKRADTFKAKLITCVDQAMLLYCRMRSCRANYVFQWPKQGESFSSAWMEICQPLPENGSRDLRDGDLKVAYSRYPALWKYGDDDGKNYNNRKLIRNAEVVVEGISAWPVTKTLQQHAEPADLDRNSQGSESTEKDWISRLKTRKSEIFRGNTERAEAKVAQDSAGSKKSIWWIPTLQFSSKRVCADEDFAGAEGAARRRHGVVAL